MTSCWLASNWSPPVSGQAHLSPRITWLTPHLCSRLFLNFPVLSFLSSFLSIFEPVLLPIANCQFNSRLLLSDYITKHLEEFPCLFSISLNSSLFSFNAFWLFLARIFFYLMILTVFISCLKLKFDFTLCFGQTFSEHHLDLFDKYSLIENNAGIKLFFTISYHKYSRDCFTVLYQ